MESQRWIPHGHYCMPIGETRRPSAQRIVRVQATSREIVCQTHVHRSTKGALNIIREQIFTCRGNSPSTTAIGASWGADAGQDTTCSAGCPCQPQELLRLHIARYRSIDERISEKVYTSRAEGSNHSSNGSPVKDESCG